MNIPGSNPGMGIFFSFQHSVQTESGAEAENSPPSNAEVKNDGATHSLSHVSSCY
jgi:hypothetical protein